MDTQHARPDRARRRRPPVSAVQLQTTYEPTRLEAAALQRAYECLVPVRRLPVGAPDGPPAATPGASRERRRRASGRAS